jgi:DNA-binding response OmpR family regulator
MKKVLLINDDPDFQYLIKSYLERKGFEAKTVDATDSVIPLVKEFNPHVIIIDMKLETDKRICTELREELKLKDVKVVLLTDKSVQSTVLHECNPDVVLQKPFQPSELIEKIAI